MKHLVILVLLALTGLVTACTPKTHATAEELALSQAANEVILPWHATFLERSKDLHNNIERFCQNPSNQGEFTEVRQAWVAAMLAWQTLHVINFGPVTVNNQSWRIQFWPDSHNRIGQKVEALLKQESDISAAQLAQSNVLVQGLSALEYMLFDPQKGHIETYENPRACAFILAASENTRNVALTLDTAWRADGDNFVGAFLSPGPNNITFPSQQEALAAIVGALVSDLEILKGRKIAEPFGGEPGGGSLNPYKVEFWRSQISIEAMFAEVTAVQQLYKSSIEPLLKAKQANVLADTISQHLKRLRNQLETMPKPLFQSIRADHADEPWRQSWQELATLLGLFKRDVTQTLGIKLGFNSNDGD